MLTSLIEFDRRPTNGTEFEAFETTTWGVSGCPSRPARIFLSSELSEFFCSAPLSLLSLKAGFVRRHIFSFSLHHFNMSLTIYARRKKRITDIII